MKMRRIKKITTFCFLLSVFITNGLFSSEPSSGIPEITKSPKIMPRNGSNTQTKEKLQARSMSVLTLNPVDMKTLVDTLSSSQDGSAHELAQRISTSVSQNNNVFSSDSFGSANSTPTDNEHLSLYRHYWNKFKSLMFGRSYLISIPTSVALTSLLWWSIQKIKWLKTEPALNREILIIIATRVLEIALSCYRKVPCISSITMYFDRIKPRLTLLSPETALQLRKLIEEFDSVINGSANDSHETRAILIAPRFHALLDFIEYTCMPEIQKKPLSLLMPE